MNARFWIRWNRDWVKLTLAPGQTITLRDGGPTDEGWSYTAHTYTRASEDLADVECSITHEASDCDGRTSDYRDYVCAFENLKANDAADDAPPRPEWDLASHRCRDQFAEAAGY